MPNIKSDKRHTGRCWICLMAKRPKGILRVKNGAPNFENANPKNVLVFLPRRYI